MVSRLSLLETSTRSALPWLTCAAILLTSRGFFQLPPVRALRCFQSPAWAAADIRYVQFNTA